VLQVRRKASEVTVRVTQKYVHDPEAVERGKELWASYLARHLSKRLAEEHARRQYTP
jgi:hypothetical protein